MRWDTESVPDLMISSNEMGFETDFLFTMVGKYEKIDWRREYEKGIS